MAWIRLAGGMERAHLRENLHVIEPLGIELERLVECGGDSLAGEVIGRGAQAAIDENHITARGGIFDRCLDRILIVGDGNVGEDFTATEAS